MSKSYPFDPKLKHHLLVGLLLALWIFVFLYFSEPLDVNELNNTEQLIYLPGYGLLGGLCYLLFMPLQYFIYRRNENNWTWISEITFLVAFSGVAIILARLFYLYVVVSGEPNPYSFGYMFKTIFLPALAVILPIIVIARFAFGKYHEKRLEDSKIEIKGEGNYEGLRLLFNDIILIKSSDNYIEVNYLSGNEIKKSLIRNKITIIDDSFPDLLRTHRSYLINPFHFLQWKTENGKLFAQLNHGYKIPVSKTYLTSVKSVINSTTN